MSDLETMVRLRQDPEMMRYMSDGYTADKSETESWLQRRVDAWTIDGFSLFAVDLKSEGACVGYVGVTKPEWFPQLMPTPEIGWFIERVRWGQGLATEGAAAVHAFAFEDLGLERLIAICNAQNVASARVMEKIGMRFWKEAPHPRFGFPLRLYESVG